MNRREFLRSAGKAALAIAVAPIAAPAAARDAERG